MWRVLTTLLINCDRGKDKLKYLNSYMMPFSCRLKALSSLPASPWPACETSPEQSGHYITHGRQPSDLKPQLPTRVVYPLKPGQPVGTCL
jgi:hypothetical protein